MYSKMAVNNVKRSFKDYTIYFLTLTFAVCLFYSFNSIDSQQAIMEINKSKMQAMEILRNVISMVSVFVSIILGSLIIYANNFLIKKRKKELGIYMTLGMPKKKISRILLLETLVIGVMSLVVGLIVGIVLSQGLSVFTAKLFEVSMSQYKFVISASAISKTALYFSLIFILVMIFNTLCISRYKLIDMLNASKKNEDIKIKNPIISVIVFILGVISLSVAYVFVEKTGLNFSDIKFKLSIALGVVGTFLFFYGLGGFVLDIIKKSKSIYFKDMNIFITKQISSKVNTNFLSMTVICLMLFITVGMLSTGLSFKNALEQGVKNTTPFDASAYIYVDEESKIKYIEDALSKMKYEFKDNQEHMFYNEYKISVSTDEILRKYIDKTNSSIKVGFYGGTNAISISDYNKIRKFKGEEPVELESNQVLVSSNNDTIASAIELLIASGDTINIVDKQYAIKNKKIITESFYSEGLNTNFFTLIVPDSVIEGLDPYISYININYVGDNDTRNNAETEITKLFDYGENGNYANYDFFIMGATKQELIEESKGLTTVVLYVGIYLGIVFLIASAAVLALQQLSEASDSVQRYKSLKRIGATNKMINRSIFIQTLIYFMVPLALAIVHSIIGIDVVSEFLKVYGKPDIGASAIITAAILILVYGGYFYATYTGYKNIVKVNM